MMILQSEVTWKSALNGGHMSYQMRSLEFCNPL